MTAVYVFDAYGTLFDVHSAVARSRERVGPQADRLSDLWRTKQLEYSWVRTMAGAYRDFFDLTADALDFAATRCGLKLEATLRHDLLAAYEQLDAFPEVKPVLTGLRERGARLAILSNGTPTMLASAIGHAGLDGLFDHVISIDGLRQYKTVPAAYRLVEDAMQIAPAAVSFQSSNRWDIAGAVRYGFRGIWINRGGLPDEYRDMAPERVLRSLEGLVE